MEFSSSCHSVYMSHGPRITLADQGPLSMVTSLRITSKIFKFGTWNFTIIAGDIKLSSGSVSGSYVLIQVQGIQDSNF